MYIKKIFVLCYIIFKYFISKQYFLFLLQRQSKNTMKVSLIITQIILNDVYMYYKYHAAFFI